MVAPKTLRRFGACAVAAAMLVAFAACGSDEEATTDGTGFSTGASTAFVPGSAPVMPPLPPGAGPHGPNPNPPQDAAPTQDAVPPKDSAPSDAPTPMDATGQ